MNNTQRLILALGVCVLVVPMFRPMNAQDIGFGGDIDVSGLLGNRGGGRGGDRGFGGFDGGGRGFPQIPDPKVTFTEIQTALKQGKTPLEKAQEKPLQTLLNSELGALSTQFQAIQNALPGNQNNNNNNPQPNAQAAQIEAQTAQKNDDFLDNKLPAFLTPEQLAMVKKAKAEDKNNATCLGGLLDRVGQNQNNNRGFNNNNANNNSKKSNGQPFCMKTDSTAAERLEPIRKVLAKGKLPLEKDKEPIAEVFMKSQMKDLGDLLRSGNGSNNGNNGNRGFNPADISAALGNRGGGPIDIAAMFGNGNRGDRGGGNNNPMQAIQGAVDNIYKKAGESLNPPQTETLQRWHFAQMLDRGGIESLVAIEALQKTPLTEEQTTKVTAAWPELRNQIQQAARAANRNVSNKDMDNAVMNKILDMLDPEQVASYQIAKKYGAQAGGGK